MQVQISIYFHSQFISIPCESSIRRASTIFVLLSQTIRSHYRPQCKEEIQIWKSEVCPLFCPMCVHRDLTSGFRRLGVAPLAAESWWELSAPEPNRVDIMRVIIETQVDNKRLMGNHTLQIYYKDKHSLWKQLTCPLLIWAWSNSSTFYISVKFINTFTMNKKWCMKNLVQLLCVRSAHLGSGTRLCLAVAWWPGGGTSHEPFRTVRSGCRHATTMLGPASSYVRTVWQNWRSCSIGGLVFYFIIIVI